MNTPPRILTPRSPHWPKVRHDYIVLHPRCIGCGGIVFLNVHHMKPFHLFPELELDPTNFATLCEDPSRLCHYRLGHCFDWHAYNPFVIEDAAQQLNRIINRKVA